MTTRRFKLGVIEGADAVGKTTQIALLKEAFSDAVYFSKFPRKDGFFGKTVYESLAGKHGDFLGLSPYLAHLPYACDQADAADELRNALLQRHVILDRYVPSNLAHQAAKLPRDGRNALIAHIEEATYIHLGALRPDFVIVLDMDAEVSASLARERGEEKDQHERNLDYQCRVREVYRDLARERAEWHLINGAFHGKPLSRALISQRIMEILTTEMGIAGS